jgi:hypothetical protein
MATLSLVLVGAAGRLGPPTGRHTPPLHSRLRADKTAVADLVLQAAVARPGPEAPTAFREKGQDAAERAMAHAISGLSAQTTQIRQGADLAIAADMECICPIVAHASCRCRGLRLHTSSPIGPSTARTCFERICSGRSTCTHANRGV